MGDITLFRKKKLSGEKITMFTCYDYSSAKLLSETDLDVILVGDSLGNVIQGLDNTMPVTIEDMIYHTRAVRRALPDIFIVTDLPFLSYHVSKEDTVRNAGKIMKESGTNAVKLEGGAEIIDSVKALIAAKIPVMGHLGLTPQSFQVFGGFKVQGKDYNTAKRIIEDALLLESAGVFAIVLEGVPEKLATLISKMLKIPTIGIGAGNNTDGQVLVFQDALGINQGKLPRFVKQFSNAGQEIINGVKSYIDEVRNKTFPTEEHTYKMDEDLYKKLESEYKE
ncbi:MAG: 3-methyl-2-oxobutanoate hydroxymethyltransferase [Spirochaetales bacterium]|nr:3-methyl-2-oxobutanoate hydroxymethyltransferase [Spirochaetales bacterium]